ncbi:MAG: glucose-6-phosphate dehydrogenase [Lentisphaerae bacterium]|mgnify:CR=1 FL=1|nr:glucose-6-phosphate dehydrogenase [Lentisphaerota bacterium]
MSIQENYWQQSLCAESRPQPNLLVVFGASGDLARRKLLPALFQLFRRGLLHEHSYIIGCARSDVKQSRFFDGFLEFLPEEEPEQIEIFQRRLSYVQLDYDEQAGYERLAEHIDALQSQIGRQLNHLFYLATPATLYAQIVPRLHSSGLSQEVYSGKPWRHVVLEKPFGSDLESAENLDRMLHKSLHERQIYRIDHYLGKETVQNILMLRFANIVFEPLWNSNFIEHVQITAAESVGLEQRAGYYDGAGQLRDMFQNHMLAMLSLVAMEPPAQFEPEAMRDEQLKLMRAIRPLPINEIDKYLLRAQYTAGSKDGLSLPAYLEEENVPPDSKTETYVAAKLFIDNWRWRGVPFYLRSGKRLSRKLSEIAITFKKPPHSIFAQLDMDSLKENQLVLNVQPEEGMSLAIQAKQPGSKLCMGSLNLEFSYAKQFGAQIPDAYERLLLDCMLGDQTLFIRSDVIAEAWKLLTPVLQAWQKSDSLKQYDCPCALQYYQAGSEGPEAAVQMFAGWRPLRATKG